MEFFLRSFVLIHERVVAPEAQVERYEIARQRENRSKLAEGNQKIKAVTPEPENQAKKPKSQKFASAFPITSRYVYWLKSPVLACKRSNSLGFYTVLWPDFPGGSSVKANPFLPTSLVKILFKYG